MNPQNPKQTQPEPRQESRGNQPTSSSPKSSGESSSPKSSGDQGRARESKPRYDDRPPSEDVQREENEGSAGQTTKSVDQRRGESTDDKSGKKTGTGGLPRYGDRETGDPRRSDVEGDGPNREGSESEA